MNVSHEKVLQKMEKEIAAAKGAPPAELEKHVYAIQSMCELLSGMTESPAADAVPAPVEHRPSPARPVQQAQPERITTGDGSNGESIFDF